MNNTSKMICPFLVQSQCKIVHDISSKSYNPTIKECDICLSSESRVNLLTITRAKKLSPSLDIKLNNSTIGTDLHSLLAPYLSEVEDCGCHEHAEILDLWTPEYIKKNIDRVVEWLAESARKRSLPFSYAITRIFLLGFIKKRIKYTTNKFSPT